MSTTAIERLTWVLIYGGLLMVGLALALRGTSETLAWAIGLAGAIETAVGVVLIWVRSRMQAPGADGDAAGGGS
jgi:hypothetical protein